MLGQLKKVLRKIEELDDSTEWDRIEKELREEFERLEMAQRDLGDEKTAQLVEQLRQQTDEVIRSKDTKMGREIMEQINGLFIQLTLVYQCMGVIQDCNRRFNTIRWSDSSRARQLLNKGMEIISSQPTVEKVLPIARGLIELMPNDEAEKSGGFLKK